MQDEKQTTGVNSFPTQESEHEIVYEQEKQIYYYSNFSLFDNEKDESTFYEYSLFMEKVSNQLGIQWKNEANRLFYPYASSREVFMNLLEIWLHHHPITNLHENKRNTQFIFNQTYVEEFITRMKQDIQRKNNEMKNFKNSKQFKINNVSVKAVCIGFFMTSNQIWEEMFQSRCQNNNKAKDFFADNPFIQGVTKTIEKTFKPVMLVSEKISSVFGKKKIKTNEQIDYKNKLNEQPDKNKSIEKNNKTNSEQVKINKIKPEKIPAEDCDHKKFQNCFQQFQRTLDIEREVERKMSEINLEQELSEYNKTGSKKIISSKVFLESEAPFQNKLMSSVYDYLTNFLKINSPWQVANTFVTNILQMNYLKTEEGTKVKVLKPAEDFYEKLLFVWLLLKNQRQQRQQIKFEEYLQAVKSKFNQIWQEKYIIPTKYFFERINKDWLQIKSQTAEKNSADVSLNNKEILGSLLKRIRKGMKHEWDQKIRLSTKRNWKSQQSIGKSSQLYKQSLKRSRNCMEF